MSSNSDNGGLLSWVIAAAMIGLPIYINNKFGTFACVLCAICEILLIAIYPYKKNKKQDKQTQEATEHTEKKKDLLKTTESFIDTKKLFAITDDMSIEEKKARLNREYRKYNCVQNSKDDATKEQAKNMIKLIAQERIKLKNR